MSALARLLAGPFKLFFDETVQRIPENHLSKGGEGGEGGPISLCVSALCLSVVRGTESCLWCYRNDNIRCTAGDLLCLTRVYCHMQCILVGG